MNLSPLGGSRPARSRVQSDSPLGMSRQKLEETVTRMARQDAESGVYMSSDYQKLEQAYVAEVAPNRAAAMARTGQMMSRIHVTGGAIVSWQSPLFGLPFRAQGFDGPAGPSAQIFSSSGEPIASYSIYNGWMSISTKAENARSRELTSFYYDAYCQARQAMRNEDQAPAQEYQLDTRA